MKVALRMLQEESASYPRMPHVSDKNAAFSKVMLDLTSVPVDDLRQFCRNLWVVELVTIELQGLKQSLIRNSTLPESRLEAVVQNAKSITPPDRSLLERVAELHGLVNQMDEARAIFEAIIRATPDQNDIYHARSLYNLAQIEAKQGRPNAAKAMLEEVVAINPEYVSAWFQLGVLNQHLGNVASARRCFDRFLQLEPMGAKADQARQLLLRADPVKTTP